MSNVQKGFFGRRANAQVARLVKQAAEINRIHKMYLNLGGDVEMPGTFRVIQKLHKTVHQKLNDARSYAQYRNTVRATKALYR